MGLWASKEQLLGALEVLGLRVPQPHADMSAGELQQQQGQPLLPPQEQQQQLSSLPPLDAAAIRSAGRRLSRLLHPDKCKLPHAADAFAEVNAASSLLLQHIRHSTLLKVSGGVGGLRGLTTPLSPAAVEGAGVGSDPSPAVAAGVTTIVTNLVTNDTHGGGVTAGAVACAHSARAPGAAGAAGTPAPALSPATPAAAAVAAAAATAPATVAAAGALVPFHLPVQAPVSDKSNQVLQALELNPGVVAAAGLDMQQLLPEWLPEDPQPPLMLLVQMKKNVKRQTSSQLEEISQLSQSSASRKPKVH